MERHFDKIDQADNALSRQVIGAALAVHRALGPGLLESTYRACLGHELRLRGFEARHEVGIPIHYRGMDIATSYRADIIVEERILVELKAVDQLLPVHEAQVLTYLRHSGIRLGFLINFNVFRLRMGLRRFVR